MGNLYAENGIDRGAEAGWRDLGDLKLDEGGHALEQVQCAIAWAERSLAATSTITFMMGIPEDVFRARWGGKIRE